MKLISTLFAFGIISLCYAQKTNFFISPGSKKAQLNSGNKTEAYPVYQQHDDTLFSWTTNWTDVSLIMYQNENASHIPLFEKKQNPPSTFTYDMNPNVNYTWNDVFFITLWNENRASEGGRAYFASSYFRINVSDSDSDPSPSPTNTPTPSPGTSDPQPTDPSDNEDSGLDPNAKVGLGVGIGLGVPALALAGFAIFYLRRRSKNAGLPGQAMAQGPGKWQDPPKELYNGGPGQQPPVAELDQQMQYEYAQPSEVHATNVGVGVQSRFMELPGN